MSSIYVTLTGFGKKTLAEIKTELETEFKEVFSDNIDLEADQPFGQLIGLLANRDADLWDALQEIYTARNPQEAAGTSLDNIVAENGITRLAATATTVINVLLKGDDATVVSLGKKAKQIDSTIEYILDAAVTIQSSSAQYGKIGIKNILDTQLYTVTIDGNGYTFTSDASATALEILNGLKVDIDAGVFAGNTTVDTVNEVLEIEQSTDFNFSVDANLEIDEVGSVGDFTADTLGTNTLPANTLIEIVTPATGWNSVNNNTPGVTGRATETDNELRLRREQSVNGVGNATEEAIRAGLLDEVDGITGVAIYSNRTSTTDGEGRPPHSFEAVIQGGDDDEIAEKIWNKAPAGIKIYGNTTINVTDTQGYTQVIKFSRPVNKYIWVEVSRDKYSEEVYPSDGDDLIKDAIVTWSLEVANIDVGKDVIRQRLSTPIYTVPGIEDIIIKLDSTPTPGGSPTYAEQNIVVGDREIAVFALGRIVVQNIP